MTVDFENSSLTMTSTIDSSWLKCNLNFMQTFPPTRWPELKEIRGNLLLADLRLTYGHPPPQTENRFYIAISHGSR